MHGKEKITARPGRELIAFERRLDQNCTPHRALLELTHCCNFRCVHCYEVSHQRHDELDTAAWLKIFDRLRKAGVLYLTFSGGEFLLRPDYRRLTRQARRRGFVLRFFTNASLVSDEVVDFWSREAWPAEIEVSLYGASEAVYSRVCGVPGAYGKTMAGLRRLAASGLKTTVKILALRENLRDLDAMIGAVEQLGLSYRVSGRLTPDEQGGLGPLKHRLPDREWPAFFARHESVRFAALGDPEDKPCNGGRTAFAVAPNGDVYPCVDLRRAVGNLLRQELADFWHSHPLLLEMRRMRNKDFVFSPARDWRMAEPPCMALNLMKTGSLSYCLPAD